MVCKKCLAVNESDAVFCEKCGTKLSESTLKGNENSSEVNRELQKEVVKTVEVTHVYSKENKPNQQPLQKKSKKKTPWVMIVVALFLLLVSGAIASYFFYFKEKWEDEKAPRYYVSATSVSLRSTPVSGVDNNYLGGANYGAELITYSYKPDWSEVKYNGIKGFVSSKYILNNADFALLNSIFGDNISREAIESNKCRMALLDYFKRNNYKGIMDSTIERKAFGSIDKNRQIWQVFTRPKDTKPNTIFYPNHIVNPSSRFTDFAFIVKNAVSGERKVILYTFSDDETPKFVGDQYAYGDNILDVSWNYYNNSYDVYYDTDGGD